MKKIVAIASFLLALQVLATAQEADLRLGFEVSPMFSTMITDDNQINGNGANLGLKLGVRGEVFFRENYAFLVGLGFGFNSGGQLRHEQFADIWQRTELPNTLIYPFPSGSDVRYNIQYVEVPFGLKFRTNEIGYLRYYFEAPIITLAFKSQAKGGVEYSNLNEKGISIKKEVNPLALSWGLGGGVEYSVSDNTSLIGGISYQRYFTDVTKDYSNAESKAVIQNIIIRLGVMF